MNCRENNEEISYTAEFDEKGDSANAESPEETELGFQEDGCPTQTEMHGRLRGTVLKAIALVSVVVAAVLGFLYAGTYVPSDAAAKVNESFVSEERVAEWIGQYRAANSLNDDEDFASALLAQGKNIASLRQEAVNQLALNDLVNARAAELGITPSDEDAQKQLDAAKESFSLGDEDVWADTLNMYHLTESGLLEQYKTNLARRDLLESEVERKDATDDELLSYIQGNLSGTAQKHTYRIVFEGEDAHERAQKCLSRLKKLEKTDNLNVAAFSETALRQSDEEGVSRDGGSYTWIGVGADEAVRDEIAGLSVGELSGIVDEEANGTCEILYCDSEYEFPSAADMEELPDDLPTELLDEVNDIAADALWSAACDDYLAALLAGAKITYYPVPDNADYNVNLTRK